MPNAVCAVAEDALPLVAAGRSPSFALHHRMDRNPYSASSNSAANSPHTI